MITAHDKIITVAKDKLLKSLKENRDKHIQQYQEAVTNYARVLGERLSEGAIYLEQIQSQPVIDGPALSKFKIDFDTPISYEREYNRAIEMLEYMEGDEVKIDEAAFNRYVRNEWDWSHAFVGNSLKYSSAAMRYGKG